MKTHLHFITGLFLISVMLVIIFGHAGCGVSTSIKTTDTLGRDLNILIPNLLTQTGVPEIAVAAVQSRNVILSTKNGTNRKISAQAHKNVYATAFNQRMKKT